MPMGVIFRSAFTRRHRRAAAGERAGLGAHASAIFFSTALKRTLRLPTSAVASATAPSSV
jgi:hypothetical protein